MTDEERAAVGYLQQRCTQLKQDAANEAIRLARLDLAWVHLSDDDKTVLAAGGLLAGWTPPKAAA
jgi:hypothetical protein